MIRLDDDRDVVLGQDLGRKLGPSPSLALVPPVHGEHGDGRGASERLLQQVGDEVGFVRVVERRQRELELASVVDVGCGMVSVDRFRCATRITLEVCRFVALQHGSSEPSKKEADDNPHEC